VADTITWLYGGYSSPHSQTPSDGHGTCIASKIVGVQCGIAKRSRLVVVKLEELTASHFLRSLADIAMDILGSKLQGRAVINISYGFNPTPLDDDGGGKPPVLRKWAIYYDLI
jgi:subtilisin family serine protease